MKRVEGTGNDELYVLVVLALGFATAAVTQAVGLSLALGAFLAGLIVSECKTSEKMLDELSPCAMLSWRSSSSPLEFWLIPESWSPNPLFGARSLA
jgi:hypothetical protein